jgi:hypothetical protein
VRALTAKSTHWRGNYFCHNMVPGIDMYEDQWNAASFDRSNLKCVITILYHTIKQPLETSIINML